jgi:uncharacterized linocin/CFP29 family protein
MEEMMRTRVAAKFLPHGYVHKKQTTVASDVVNVPAAGAPDLSLNVDEAKTNRIQEYWVQFRMSVAQVENEEHDETIMGHTAEIPEHPEPGASGDHQIMNSLRASTGVSLAMRTANILAQAEDLVLFNGQNAMNSPLFVSRIVQALDPNLKANLDLGLLNITSDGDIRLPYPDKQVIRVKPAVKKDGLIRYAENTLNAVANGFSILQGLGHYEHYALALSTIPYADLHEALPTTLIQPVEPISHLIKAGIYGTGTLPPFSKDAPTGLPTKIAGNDIQGKVLHTGVLVSLSGNTMDHVRGLMEDHLDVMVTFNQRDRDEQYRFRVVERFCLRLKDQTAVVVLLFMDE